LKYLYVTRDDGIYFWRAKPLLKLPEHDLPTNSVPLHGTLPEKVYRPEHGPFTPHSYVDASWADCPITRRSMTGVDIKLAGGPIAYKTKLQPTVAMSSTEAEFMAACDAGKMLLFIRLDQFYTISMFLNKRHQFYMRTMTHVRQWRMHKSQQLVQDTWTFGTLRYVTG
jgi:hypothetical protein